MPQAIQWRRGGARFLSRPCKAGLASSSHFLSKPPFPLSLCDGLAIALLVQPG